MAFIVPDVCRYTLNHEFQGRDVANILDIAIRNADTGIARAEACAGVGRLLLDAWATEIVPLAVASLSFVSVQWVDLNAEAGSVGLITAGDEETLPVAGTQPADPLPSNVSILVRKETTARRGARAGRMYLAGGNEGYTAGNTLSGSVVTAYQEAFDALQAALTEDASPPDPSWDPRVVHILTRDVNGNPLTGDSSEITSFNVQALLATQRRRLRG